MEQYLQALRGRDDVSEEVLLELEERFKVVEEVVDVPIVPTEIELLQERMKVQDAVVQEILFDILPSLVEV